MRKPHRFTAIFYLFLISCNGSDGVSDPALCSYLDVQNISNYVLVLTFEPHYLLPEYPITLTSGETKEIYHLCEIGTNPELAMPPSEILDSFEVMTEINEISSIVYNGIDDTEWQKTIFEDAHARYTLVLSDININL